uniref:uncharacterized protein LOC122594077 n=1 Tax=Erigeron canadensis TaxID=72917 RepID=UPI001CB9802E|nr:uncharacterized protein LOC122594077 [Erigeron canadensis]
MQQQFLDEYYTMQKTSDARTSIRTFQQQSGETFHEAFKRFNELLRTCPHHGIAKWELITTFYDGLLPEEKRDVNSISNGTFLTNPEDVDWEFLEKMNVNSKRQAQSNRRARHPIASSSSTSDQATKDRLEALEWKFAKLGKVESQGVAQVSQEYPICESCNELGHMTLQCPLIPEQVEEVNQVYGEKRPFDMNSNTYHPGMRNHPNLRYGNSSNQLNPIFQGNNQTGGAPFQPFQGRNYNQGNYQGGQNQGFNRGYPRNFQQGNNQGGASGSNEVSTGEIMEYLKEMDRKNEIRDKTVESLQKQVGQLAKEVSELRKNPGKLPSDTKINPQHQSGGPKNVKNVEINNVSLLRSGKVYDNKVEPPSSLVDGVVEDVDDDQDSEHEPEFVLPKPSKKVSFKEVENNRSSENFSEKQGKDMEGNTIPFPLALIDPKLRPTLKKRGPHEEEMWEIFKQVKINIPLIDIIKQVPAYAKYLKELCTQKRHHKLPKKIVLNEEVSAVVMAILPPKLQDPGAPLITIQVGDFKMNKALLDMGAGVSILPGMLYDQYDFGPLEKVDTTLVMADLSLKLPRGIVQDVIVKVEDFYYPVDFLVLDFAPSGNVRQPNVIMGRPFLATANALIDCRRVWLK